MKRDVTAEEKLLKLIRKKEPSKPDKKKEKTSKPAKTAKESSKVKKFSVDLLSLANKLLILASLAFIALGVYKYLNPADISLDLSSYERTADSDSSKERLEDFSMPERRSYDYYQDFVDSRQIFTSPWEKPKSEQKVTVPTEDLSGILKVVGIVLDDQPQAIIEDIKAKQTYFLRIGEEIATAVIEDIQEGKVIFSYNGSSVELTP